MNKVILMGRLTKDPEVTYSNNSANPLAIAKFTLAVDRRFKRDGEPTADFIMCTAFGKTAETMQTYVKKGVMISVYGRIQVRSWTDTNTDQKRWATDVIVDEFYFTGSKADGESQSKQNYNYGQEPAASAMPMTPVDNSSSFTAITEPIMDDEDLPF